MTVGRKGRPWTWAWWAAGPAVAAAQKSRLTTLTQSDRTVLNWSSQSETRWRVGIFLWQCSAVTPFSSHAVRIRGSARVRVRANICV